MPNFPNYRLGPIDGSPCDTLGIDNVPLAGFVWEADTLDPLKVYFVDNSFYEPASWSWDFGDSGVSGEKDPVHAYASPGSYEVCLTVSNANGGDTFCRTVEVEGPVVANGEVRLSLSKLYPNPCGEFVYVDIGTLGQGAEIAFYNAVGQHLFSRPLQKGPNTVHLKGLGPGVYFYHVLEGEAPLESGKLVKVE